MCSVSSFPVLCEPAHSTNPISTQGETAGKTHCFRPLPVTSFCRYFSRLLRCLGRACGKGAGVRDTPGHCVISLVLKSEDQIAQQGPSIQGFSPVAITLHPRREGSFDTIRVVVGLWGLLSVAELKVLVLRPLFLAPFRLSPLMLSGLPCESSASGSTWCVFSMTTFLLIPGSAVGRLFQGGRRACVSPGTTQPAGHHSGCSQARKGPTGWDDTQPPHGSDSTCSGNGNSGQLMVIYRDPDAFVCS